MSLRTPVLPLLFTALIAAATAATPPGIPDRWTDGYVYANGIRIHYYHAMPAPGKPVIVMAHGATDIGLSWTTLTKELQADYDIYMVDARGHGLSDPPTAADTGDTGVEDLVGFIHAMKLGKTHIDGAFDGSVHGDPACGQVHGPSAGRRPARPGPWRSSRRRPWRSRLLQRLPRRPAP